MVSLIGQGSTWDVLIEQVIIEGGKYDAIEEYKNEMIWKTGHNKT